MIRCMAGECKETGDNRCCVECVTRSQCPTACHQYPLRAEILEKCNEVMPEE